MLLVRHLLLEAMHLFLVASLLRISQKHVGQVLRDVSGVPFPVVDCFSFDLLRLTGLAWHLGSGAFPV